MEFDKSKVYTALNADELKIGSKVIAANNIDSLVCKVHNGDDIVEVRDILILSCERRFLCNGETYPFVYLVLEPEKNWIVYLFRGPSNPENYYLTSCRSDRWEIVQKDYGAKTKLFEGTEEECIKWYTDRIHLANVIAAWEDGKTIQFFIDGWNDVEKPKWCIHNQYRIKPEGLKWTDLKIGDVIRNKDYTRSMMVIGIDHREGEMSHIFTGAEWFTDDDLECWEKVE